MSSIRSQIACRVAVALGLSLAITGAGQAQAPADPPAIPRDTPLGTGAFKAIMEVDPGLPTHTAYHPANMAALGSQKLPIVVWGNGACVNTGNRFRWFLSEIASHGYLVVAVGPIGPSSMEGAPRPAGATAAAPPQGRPANFVIPPPETKSSQLNDAITWAVAENSRKGSAWFGKLAPAKVAVMGQSCGGVQAIEASADPRTATTVIWNSGLPANGTSMAGGRPLTKADLKFIHAPIAYISGDEQDQAWPNANDDFERIQGLPVFRGYEKGVPHAGTYREVNGGSFGKVAVGWLDWRLKGDAAAAKMFRGADCGLCIDPKWVVKKKNID